MPSHYLTTKNQSVKQVEKLLINPTTLKVLFYLLSDTNQLKEFRCDLTGPECSLIRGLRDDAAQLLPFVAGSTDQENGCWFLHPYTPISAFRMDSMITRIAQTPD